MEFWFKIACALLFAGVIGAAVQAAGALRRRPEAKIDQTEHELPVLKLLRPALGLVFYGSIGDWLLPGTRMAWARLALPVEARWAGAGIAALAVAVLWWSFRTLGSNYRGGVGLWDDHELVAHGPYRYVQHPIYGAFVLAMVGTALLSASWLAAASGIALTVSIPLLRLPVEEPELAARFGDRYARYREATARFLPWLY